MTQKKTNKSKFSKREDFPSIKVNLTAYNTRMSDATNGKGLLTMIVDYSSVSDSENNEELGIVGSGLGNVVIRTKKGYYMISHKDIWNAIAEQEEKDDIKEIQ